MPMTTDPPRSGLTQSVRDFIAGCTWSNSQLVDGSNNVITAALTQAGTPGKSVIVEWLANRAADHGDAIAITIPQGTYDIIKNGTFDSTTGEVTYGSKAYVFQHVKVGGVPTMLAVFA